STSVGLAGRLKACLNARVICALRSAPASSSMRRAKWLACSRVDSLLSMASAWGATVETLRVGDETVVAGQSKNSIRGRGAERLKKMEMVCRHSFGPSVTSRGHLGRDPVAITDESM